MEPKNPQIKGATYNQQLNAVRAFDINAGGLISTAKSLAERERMGTHNTQEANTVLGSNRSVQDLQREYEERGVPRPVSGDALSAMKSGDYNNLNRASRRFNGNQGTRQGTENLDQAAKRTGTSREAVRAKESKVEKQIKAFK